MAIYRIEALYEYSADIEADSPEEAENLFLDDLNVHYVGTYSYECEELEEDEEEDDNE